MQKKFLFSDLTPEEQVAFYKIAEEKKVDPETGFCKDSAENSIANSNQAMEKRLQRMYKQAKKAVEINEPQISSLTESEKKDKGREIEEFWANLRTRRKTYINTEPGLGEAEEERLKKICFSEDEIKTLGQLIRLYELDNFRYLACDLIIEGLKYPQKEVKKLCYEYFKETLEKGIVDMGVIISILGKEYVSKCAWRLLVIFQEYFVEFNYVFKASILIHSEDQRTKNNWEKIKSEEEIIELFPDENKRDILKLYCE